MSDLEELTDEQKRMIAVGTGLLAVVVAAKAFPAQFIALCASAAVYLTLQKPEPETFRPFFEQWFKSVFYPMFSAQLDNELRERARRHAHQGHILQSLGNSAMSMLARSTTNFQSSVLLEAILQQNPMVIQDRGPYLSVTVNLGSSEHPNRVTFWGVHGQWMLAPYIVIDTSARILGENAAHSM
mmetsp:Transcript_14931/g.29023  ORF Transcript_14931/g.29023 Transcript_14931/m.29023 type:complete len:184 (-) Transcript_14931:2874-3425(-)